MILWTIQPEMIYEMILEQGVYRCDYNKSSMKEWKMQYDWLVKQMINRIGERPSGVSYPVWAWYKWEGIRKKPDLRCERWGNGWKGERFVCMEIDIPEKDVLLTDFDAWSIILLDALISYSEEEDEYLEKIYKSLSPEKQKMMKEKNWEKVFDISPFDNTWICRGNSVQATFWELKRKQIKEVRPFTAATPKPVYLCNEE